MPPRLSVIIPTHRRVDALCDCLQSIAGQTVKSDAFEILIVDDGSPQEEHERLQGLVRSRFDQLPITAWRQEQSGPARARNEAVRRAEAPLMLILNDDVTLAPDHFAAHLAAHEGAPKEHVVFRGLTEWAPDTPDTPVMRWMRSASFRYDWDLCHPVEAHFVNFHTCDLSMKRSLLLAFPFDETFDVPCCEDTDLALRLMKAGRLDLRLLETAHSWHHHPHDIAALRRRAAMQGRAMALLLERHPELEWRARSGYLQLAPMWRRRLRALRHRILGPSQRRFQELHDLLMLRELNRRLPPPAHGDGGPYPQRLLDAIPADSPAMQSIEVAGSQTTG